MKAVMHDYFPVVLSIALYKVGFKVWVSAPNPELRTVNINSTKKHFFTFNPWNLDWCAWCVGNTAEWQDLATLI